MDVLDTVIYTLDGQVMGLVLDDGVSAYQRAFEYHRQETIDHYAGYEPTQLELEMEAYANKQWPLED